MNAGKNKNMLVYQDLVRKLQHAIAARPYDEGGWLPSAQALAAQFGASRLTCLKAMRFLQIEGLVRSVPPRGFYVTPKEMRHRKIAIIYGSGETSPFFRQGLPSEETRQNCDMSAAIDYISQRGYYAQMIQASRPEQLAAIAGSYGVVGAIWFFPRLSFEPVVRELLGSEIPTLLVNPEPLGEWQTPYEIRYDFDAIRRDRTLFLLSRGHLRILFIGSYADAVKSRVEAEILKAGGKFGKNHCLGDLYKNADKLEPLISALKITAILSAVSEEQNAFLRQALSKIPYEKQPETLMWDVDCLPKMGDLFEPVKTIHMNRKMASLPGLIAAREMVCHLETGEPLRTVRIGYALSRE
ncbi:MAG: GntR family transcriptional regulator [Kiritimatiellae bacterium]|nr:GntR family transcriptional regulator [Kiritimatiellia bacterium]